MTAPAAVPLYMRQAVVSLAFDSPVGGVVSVAVAGNLFTTTTAHGLAIGDRVRFLSMTGGTPIVVGSTYYVLTAPSGTTFTVSATLGGAAVVITLAGTAGSIARYVDVACHVSDVAIVPTPGKVITFTPLCPDGAVSEVGADTFALEFTGAQDWAPGGLARLLWDNAGETVLFAINAYGGVDAASTPGMKGSARVVRPSYGGKAEEYAPLDVSLPIIGIPTLAVA